MKFIIGNISSIDFVAHTEPQEETDGERNHPNHTTCAAATPTVQMPPLVPPGSENSIKLEIDALPYHCVHRAHVRALSDIIAVSDQVSDSDSDDDCLIVGSSNMPIPLRSTMEGLIKQDNDSISGNKPFIVTVSVEN